MISLVQYFGGKPHTAAHVIAAKDLLARREALREEYRASTDRPYPDIDPDTGTEISGARGGSGDGGFRLKTATTGRRRSSHMDATGVDDYDPRDEFDNWLSKFDIDGGKENTMLELYGLYREHPKYTPGWVHLTTRAPGSGKRTFIP